jgi:peptidylprolyl isomerase
VGGRVRDRQRPKRADVVAARIAEAEHARARRRRTIALATGAGVVVVAVIVAIVVATGGDGNDEVATVANTGTTGTSSGTSTTIAALASVAGQPCVPVADPLPEGAPEVPVQVGPPPTTLVVQDLTPGTGATVAAGDSVTVNYIGVACSTGKIFDSSYQRGGPATISLSGVVKGWQDGIPGMQVGGTRLLGIPSDQGYGAVGFAPDIAPDEALWFVIQVTDTQPAS